MSTTPSWKEKIESVLAENMKKGNKDSLNVQFATMPLPGSPARPSVRTVVYRGFAGQPRKDDEPTGGNPTKDVTSNLIIVSSDTRMLKARQLAAQQSHGENGFELCWWHQGTQEQFRISGHAWLLCPPGSNNSFPDSRLHDLISLPNDDKWTWEGERRRQFAKHSPSLRGSFLAPEPGSKATESSKAQTESLPEPHGSIEDAESEEERKRVSDALKNFSLIVLEVEEVDYLFLGPPPSRTRWTLSGKEWQEEEINP